MITFPQFSMKAINKNKKAFFEYQILDVFIAGLVLSGSEVKSVKANNVSIAEAFCRVISNEVFILNMHINPYSQDTDYNPTQNRKLLLNKKEIIKISKTLTEKGLTLIPLTILLSDTGLIKLEIGIGKGKKLYDKKNAIKERDTKRAVKIEFNK